MPDSFSTLDYYKGKADFFDAREKVHVVKILSGEWHVSTRPDEVCVTILGSCVSACIRDPFAKVGGMNHFLLPGEDNNAASASARYGVYAMECLINGLLQAGGRKDRFEVKVFGGGNVIQHSARIGSRNAAFIRSFLHKEHLAIAAEDLEGDCPRRIHYYPATGRVMLRALHRKEDMIVLDEEKRYAERIATKPIEGSVELF